MAVQYANLGIVENNLQLYYNREWSKSFRGEATTNLIGTYNASASNSYPSSGNNWGTFEVRDGYNNNVYFSIGSIYSVSGNVISVSSATTLFNSLATYDVITPQTTGGGVTAGTYYFFKRVSGSSFTLHEYVGTDNASKSISEVLYYINNDIKISVNATNFPTVWWAPPHVPNSGLIKTTITDGFSFDGRTHDCLRLNWFRPATGSGQDGMAYGVTPSYSINTQYTISCYVRASSQNAIGSTISNQIYFTGTATYEPTFYSPTLTTQWQKWTKTFTSSGTAGIMYFYFFPSFTLPGSVDIAEIQLEQKSYATEFAPISRSANTVAGGGGLLDISGNKYTADLNSAAVAFDSGGFYFNGDAAGALTTPIAGSILDGLSNNTHTYECWFKLLGTPPGLYDGYFFGRQGYHEGFVHIKSGPNALNVVTWYNDNTAVGLGVTLTLNNWYHGVYIADVENATRKLYINGVLVDSNTLTKQLRQYVSTVPYYVGAASAAYAGNCIVSVARAYNRALTDSEIQQNFNAQRKTYGI